MEPRKLKRTRRHLPHWELAGSTYFITFRLKHGELNHAERRIVCDHITSGDPTFYRLYALVVMPDHVHLLARPNDTVALSSMMKGIMGVTARLLNQRRGTTGPIWLNESYDRIMRDADEAIKMASYMQDNPRRAGLIADDQTYPFWYLGRME